MIKTLLKYVTPKDRPNKTGPMLLPAIKKSSTLFVFFLL